MTSHRIEPIRTAAVALAVLALVTPFTPASPRPAGAQDADAANVRQFSEESPVPEVRDALARIGASGQVRSVAIDFLTPQEVNRVRKDLMPRLALNLYAGKLASLFSRRPASA